MNIYKFRVWNGLEMVYDVMVGKFGVFYVNPGDRKDGLDPKDTACLNPFNTKYYGNIPVMEFTGLQDKNGKEIYEGDIIQCNANTGVVEWDNIRLNPFDYISTMDYIHGVVPKYTTDKTVIIGNIYENPELIDKI